MDDAEFLNQLGLRYCLPLECLEAIKIQLEKARENGRETLRREIGRSMQAAYGPMDEPNFPADV